MAESGQKVESVMNGMQAVDKVDKVFCVSQSGKQTIHLGASVFHFDNPSNGATLSSAPRSHDDRCPFGQHGLFFVVVRFGGETPLLFHHPMEKGQRQRAVYN